MRKKSYPSDMSRERFDQIRPLLEQARRKTKPRIVDLYEVCARCCTCCARAASGERCRATSPSGANKMKPFGLLGFAAQEIVNRLLESPHGSRRFRIERKTDG